MILFYITIFDVNFDTLLGIKSLLGIGLNLRLQWWILGPIGASIIFVVAFITLTKNIIRTNRSKKPLKDNLSVSLDEVKAIQLQLYQIQKKWEDDYNKRINSIPTGLTLVDTLKVKNISALSMSPTKPILAYSDPSRIITLYDTYFKKNVITLRGHIKVVNCIAWSPDGRLIASASDDKTVRLWDSTTGSCLYTLNGHTDWIQAVTWSPDGRLIASAGNDKKVFVWELTPTLDFTPISRFSISKPSIFVGHTGIINCLTWSPDSKLLISGSSDGSVRAWNSNNGKAEQLLEGNGGPITTVAFSSDGQILIAQSSQGDNAIHFWQVASWSPIAYLPVYSYLADLAHRLEFFFDKFITFDTNLARDLDLASKRYLEALDGALASHLALDHALDRQHTFASDAQLEPERVLILMSDLTKEMEFARANARINVIEIVSDINNNQDIERTLVIARKRAINVALGLIFSLALARDRAFVFGLARRYDFDHALIEARELVRILALDLAYDRNRVLSFDLDRALVFDLDFALATDLINTLSLAFAGDLDNAHARDVDSVRDRNRAQAFTRTSDLTAILVRDRAFNRLLSIRQDGSMMASYGDSDGTIAIWNVNTDQLSGAATGGVMHYTNAKVVLLGESGVGKTSLGMALMGMSFHPQESTHGRTVWTLEDSKVALGSSVSEHREVLLWDMAGQQGYRVVHQLYLDDAAVALLVFDNLDETGSFGEIYYWARALRQARALQGASARPQKSFLVAARIDRGGAGVSRERINHVVHELGFDGFFLTSARERIGIDELRQTILSSITWSDMLKVTSTEVFQRIKRFLVSEKEAKRVLSSREDLYRTFIQSDDGKLSGAKRNEFDICIDRVAGSGLIQHFEWGDYVLLQPELLDAYASALVIAARDEPDGLGSILVENALGGQFLIPSDLRDEAKVEIEQVLLLAMVNELIRRDLAIIQRTQEGEYMVFPAQTQRERSEFPEPRGQSVRYDFEGPIISLYATLAVRLARSSIFGKPEIYRNAIQFTSPIGGTYGLLLHNKGEGLASLTLFFGDQTPITMRVVFESFVAEHLGMSLNLQREPIFRCSNCGLTVISPEAAEQIRSQNKTSTSCNVCGTSIPLVENRELMQSPAPVTVIEINAQADQERDSQAWVTVRRGTKNYDVFFSYNVADREAVHILAKELINNGIMPWLYEWDEVKGRRFMAEIMDAISHCRTGAILVSDNGIGQWQEEEIDALLAETKRRSLFAVIPVILPGATKRPIFPHFSSFRGSVDLRLSFPDPLSELIRAITGLLPFNQND